MSAAEFAPSFTESVGCGVDVLAKQALESNIWQLEYLPNTQKRKDETIEGTVHINQVFNSNFDNDENLMANLKCKTRLSSASIKSFGIRKWKHDIH